MKKASPPSGNVDMAGEQLAIYVSAVLHRSARTGTNRSDSGVMAAREERDVGLRVIVIYKFVRGAAVLALAISLLIGGAFGLDDRAHEYIQMVEHHFTAAWIHRLARLVARLITARNVILVGAGLCLDGSFSLFEGWALRRRFPWAPWLVVVASSTFIPFELVALFQRVRATRVAIVLINVAIVVYLAMRVRREHAAHAARQV